MCVFMGDCACEGAPKCKCASLKMSTFVYRVRTCPVCPSGCVLQCQNGFNSVKCTTLAKTNAMQSLSWACERGKKKIWYLHRVMRTDWRCVFRFHALLAPAKSVHCVSFLFQKQVSVLWMNTWEPHPTYLWKEEGSVFISQCTEMTALAI